jgi:hypothetical protein
MFFQSCVKHKDIIILFHRVHDFCSDFRGSYVHRLI